MPKMKTHKASKKRFRVTATGKLKRSQAGKKHLNSHKTGKRKRHLRGTIIDNGKLAKKYVCEECIKTGDDWVHLRTCQTCGATLCCDQSRNTHMTKHFHHTQHPSLARSSSSF